MLTNTNRGGIWIYKNSQQLTLAFAGHNPQWDGASVSAAMWLDVGDQVYLRSYYQGKRMLKGFVTVIEHNDGLRIQFLYIYEKPIKTKKNISFIFIIIQAYFIQVLLY